MTYANAVGINSLGENNRMQIQNNEIQCRQRIVEERDSFILWLRGEFAAANAIVDALCQHLRIIGEAGEYDYVLTCLQQRRCNWAGVLHMQQYFSIAEVLHSIQQVSWRKQQRKQSNANTDHNPSFQICPNAGNVKFRADSAKKLGHRVSLSHNGSKNEGFVSRGSYVDKTENVGANTALHSNDSLTSSSEGIDILSESRTIDFDKTSSSENAKKEEKTKHEGEVRVSLGNVGSNGREKHEDSKNVNSERNEPSQRGMSSRAEEATGAIAKIIDGSVVANQSGPCNGISANLDFRFISKHEEDRRRSMIMVSKFFFGNELVDGKMVNVVEGLELYESVFDSSELSQLTSLVQELRLAGRQKQLRGQTFVVSKRPMKGNGREMIQFGVPIINVPVEEEIATRAMKELVEPIPTVLEDVIDRLFRWQILSEKRPDSCIINFFNEGDHSQPHISPSHFERPLCIMSLMSECSMVFGRSITINHPGDYKGPYKISLHAGSLVVMQGNSADIARCAICSSPVQRVTITFVKVRPKKASTFLTIPNGMPHSSSLSNSHFPQPVERQSSTNSLVPIPREGRGVSQTTLKHFNVVRTSGVLHVPSMHTSQVNSCPPAPRIQLLLAGPTGPVGTYPSMTGMTPAWSAGPRNAPMMSSSGTGVFFPCSGSGSGPCQSVTMPLQQQGAPSGLPKSEPSFKGATSTEPPGTACSTLRSKATTANQLAFDNVDRDTESSSTSVKFDSAATKSALSKDIVNKAPQMDSNGSRIPKGDQLNRTASLSKNLQTK